MDRRRLPIDIQNFRGLREANANYVDKTPYTESALDRVFARAGLHPERVREWCDGYRWRGTEKVYNPYDVYSCFAALGYEIVVKKSRSHGGWTWVRTGGHAYLFEFKVVELAPPGSALAQSRERRYTGKYRAEGEPTHLIGVEFSRETRNVTAFDVAHA